MSSGDMEIFFCEKANKLKRMPSFGKLLMRTRIAPPSAFSRAYRSNPDVDELLDQLLPPKQAVYIDVIWQAVDAEQLAVAKTAWARLIKLQPPPHLMLRDIDHFVARLLQAGEFSEARRVWDEGTATMKLPPLFQLPSSVVWDPSFETGITNAVFSWHYSPLVQGVSVGLDRTEQRSRRSVAAAHVRRKR